MSDYNQSQAAVTRNDLPRSAGEVQGGYMAPPPPVGYPVKDGEEVRGENQNPSKTRSRGDGFWKGCCAALCCCCVLDACF